MKRLFGVFNRPWLHFLLLGYALWQINLWAYPPEPPTVGPISEARIESLRTQWVSLARRAPSEEQMEQLILAELDREMLYLEAIDREYHLVDGVVRQRLIRNMRFLQLDDGRDDETIYREALNLELHLGDEVVKRRLQQLMETVLLSRAEIDEPAEDAVRARFEERRESFWVPARYTFRHLYFPTDRADEVAALSAQVRDESLSPEVARQHSSPFLPGLEFRSQSLDQVARNFGSDFSAALGAQEPLVGQWLGPLESVYGQHLVWIDAYVPGRDSELEEVRSRITRDLAEENRRVALAEQIDLLRSTYRVVR